MSTENSSGKIGQECPDFGQGEGGNNVGLPFPSHSKLSKTGGDQQEEAEKFNPRPMICNLLPSQT
jgi:hypothetical protein